MRRIPLLAILCLVAACGSTAPSANPSPSAAPTAIPTPSPSPTPTPVPTPLPSLPPLDVSAFEPGWTLAATDTNDGPVHETAILSTIGPHYAVAVVCVGEGELVVTLRAAGGDLKKDHPDGVEAGSVTVQCTNLTPTITEFDGTSSPPGSASRSPRPPRARSTSQYRIAVGTAG